MLVSPRASGNDGTAPYTSSRVFPIFAGISAPYSADRAWPYITAGKLFFTVNGTPRFCSASVIQRRIVVTAGHCVHSGTAAGFYRDWLFVPAFRDGNAPLLTWRWRAAIVTATWATSNGYLPNPADYAMIEFGDQALGGAVRALGDVTGWLGWQTLSLNLNHTTKLGYAGNLDGGQKMQQITSADVGATVENNVVSGSDGKDGFDGAPWIQNFQVLQAGGGAGANNGSNRVVGVVSRFYAPGPFKVQAQSSPEPDGRWVDLFNASCARTPDNCR
ncbi:trypsin-like serine protease [Massilia sp. Dwa41.01b]|uniref:trypsin-like serine peptidase n=1 Tax=Massilia sp. Dwa41.01b TaxID=2709302 RepID=UPI0015FFBDC0|nr:trypsin-like serine protease [Massilia sp. Dwa41.01b]QNA88668.1 trypsin-like serine protease [Massilia sp. Dwa41.01b]